MVVGNQVVWKENGANGKRLVCLTALIIFSLIVAWLIGWSNLWDGSNWFWEALNRFLDNLVSGALLVVPGRCQWFIFFPPCYAALLSFDIGPPFTLQRLCEVILSFCRKLILCFVFFPSCCMIFCEDLAALFTYFIWRVRASNALVVLTLLHFTPCAKQILLSAQSIYPKLSKLALALEKVSFYCYQFSSESTRKSAFCLCEIVAIYLRGWWLPHFLFVCLAESVGEHNADELRWSSLPNDGSRRWSRENSWKAWAALSLGTEWRWCCDERQRRNHGRCRGGDPYRRDSWTIRNKSCSGSSGSDSRNGTQQLLANPVSRINIKASCGLVFSPTFGSNILCLALWEGISLYLVSQVGSNLFLWGDWFVHALNLQAGGRKRKRRMSV